MVTKHTKSAKISAWISLIGLINLHKSVSHSSYRSCPPYKKCSNTAVVPVGLHHHGDTTQALMCYCRTSIIFHPSWMYTGQPVPSLCFQSLKRRSVLLKYHSPGIKMPNYSKFHTRVLSPIPALDWLLPKAVWTRLQENY